MAESREVAGFTVADADRIAEVVREYERRGVDIPAGRAHRRTSAAVMVWCKPTALNVGGLYYDGKILYYDTSGTLVEFGDAQIYSVVSTEQPPTLNSPYLGRIFGYDEAANLPKVVVRFLGSDGATGTYVDVITKICPSTELIQGMNAIKPFLMKTYR
jgi:hypothetical protein